MAKGGKGGKNGGNIVIKKEEVVEGGHHGGAWKVAYADFVTAMMAFFLLMWLINATTEEQRKGLADYFSPTSVLGHTLSGSGQPFGGHTPFDEGMMASDKGAVQVMEGKLPIPSDPDEDESADTPAQNRTYQKDATPQNPDTSAQGDSLRPPLSDTPGAQAAGAGDAAGPPAGAGPQVAGPPAPGAMSRAGAGQNAAQLAMAGPMSEAAMPQSAAARAAAAQAAQAAQASAQAAAQAAAQERRQFADAAQQIREAVQHDPALSQIGRQLAIDVTPEGLRIQILDEVRLPMFASGSAAPNDRARQLLQKVVPILNKLSESISIAGYTDATPYPGTDRTNWELSTERANATRHLLTEAGLSDARIQSVTGHADRDPLLPEQPTAAANRRIAIMVLRSAPAPVRAPSTAAAPAASLAPASSPGPASSPALASSPSPAPASSPALAATVPPALRVPPVRPGAAGPPAPMPFVPPATR